MVEEDHPHRFRAYSRPTGSRAASTADSSCEVRFEAMAFDFPEPRLNEAAGAADATREALGAVVACPLR